MKSPRSDIPIVYTKVLLDLLSERGFHPSSILRGTGIELSSIADPETKITLAQQLAIYEAALGVSQIGGLGLLQGQRMAPGHLGIMGYAIQTSASLYQALRILVSYSPISGALVDFSLRDEGDIQTLSAINISVQGDIRRYVLEEHFVTIDRILKIITNNEFRPIKASFDYVAPPWMALYEEVFACQIEFNAQRPAYQFETAKLSLEIVLSDPETSKACEQRCEATISQMGRAGSYIDRVRRTVLMLPSKSRSLGSVAKEMGTSPRSLRRRLAEMGTTFQKLLDEVRLELAQQYLKNSSLPLEDIASLLGYSEGASFRHAFKKWTGLAPGRYRKAEVKKVLTNPPNQHA